jgi:hypothetical protein
MMGYRMFRRMQRWERNKKKAERLAEKKKIKAPDEVTKLEREMGLE